jgi:hypothetical protein
MATKLKDVLREWIRPAVFLSHNRLTEAGGVLTTSSALTLLMFWVYESSTHGRHVHPYAGILLFLILPSIFVVGLVLMPVGVASSAREASFRRSTRSCASPIPSSSAPPSSSAASPS